MISSSRNLPVVGLINVDSFLVFTVISNHIKYPLFSRYFSYYFLPILSSYLFTAPGIFSGYDLLEIFVLLLHSSGLEINLLLASRAVDGF